MKKINVIVKGKELLELAEDGKKGDLIDLKELTQVDESYIDNIIASGKDKAFNSRIEEVRKTLNAENLVKINELNNKISSLEKQHESELKINAQNIEKEYLNKIADLNNIIEKLKEANAHEKDNILNEKNLEINKLQTSIETLKKENESALVIKEQEVAKTYENNIAGVDIAIFGNSINIFKKRVTFAGESILKQYYDSLDIYKGEYIVEKIDGGFRKKAELIPFEAYREVLANAIVHRTWDINANTKIEMYQDKIIISSPGGLDGDMTKEDYIKGNYSYLRNPIIANVFRRLNIIEAFATGIKRISEAYKNAYVKPTYNVTPSAISITLPVIEDYSLSLNEAKVIDSIKDNYLYSRADIEKISGFTKDKLIRLLASLQEKGLIEKSGKGRTTYYKKK